MTEEPDSGPSILCPSCVRYVPLSVKERGAWLTCPRCGHRWRSPSRVVADAIAEEADPELIDASAVRAASLRAVGMVLYVAGAAIAFSGFPRPDDGIFWLLRGWSGILGAILLGVSPRSGVIRSLGLIALWISGLFIGKHPIPFIMGSVILITGIALFNRDPPVFELPADEEPPPDASAE